MVMDVNETYCEDHFTAYTSIESLCCIPETNRMLYVNYTSVKTKNYFVKKMHKKITQVIHDHVDIKRKKKKKEKEEQV